MPIDPNHRFTCNKCDYSCNKESNFNKHLDTKKHHRALHNVADVKIHICSTCDYTCSKLSNYNKHLNTKKHKELQKVADKYKDIVSTSNYKFICESCDYKCSKLCNYKKHLETNRHRQLLRLETKLPNCSNDSSGEEVKQMVIACMQNQGFLQTMVTTLATTLSENQKVQLENHKNQLENQKNQIEFQNKFLEVLPTLGTTNIQTQNQNNTFNLTNYLTIDCKDAETLDETKLRLKDYILGLDTVAFIEHAANSSSNAIMERVIRGFYSNIEPCKRSIQTVDVARGKSYVKHDENGFVLDDEGNAVSKIACAAAHHSVNHCIRYKDTMKNPDKTWKPGSIGSEYDNVDSKVNNMWRFTDANEVMAKKIVGSATKIDKTTV